jgi:hypothetical protein
MTLAAELAYLHGAASLSLVYKFGDFATGEFDFVNRSSCGNTLGSVTRSEAPVHRMMAQSSPQTEVSASEVASVGITVSTSLASGSATTKSPTESKPKHEEHEVWQNATKRVGEHILDAPKEFDQDARLFHPFLIVQVLFHLN